jgi:hypothetical protein
MDRRAFLKALIGLGAVVALPLRPTEEQVDEAWDQLVRRPFIFEVDDHGTIAEPGGAEPRVNRDVYGDHVEPKRITSVKALIETVREHTELQSVFVALAADELYDAELTIEQDNKARKNGWDDHRLAPVERARAERIVELIRDPDYDWPAWVRAGGVCELPRFIERIEQWLAGPVNWSGMEWWPRGWSGQGRALQFFQMLDRDDRDALCIVIVEGEHPGSSYFAAELRAPIAEANATAEALELPFRFAAEG